MAPDGPSPRGKFSGPPASAGRFTVRAEAPPGAAYVRPKFWSVGRRSGSCGTGFPNALSPRGGSAVCQPTAGCSGVRAVGGVGPVRRREVGPGPATCGRGSGPSGAAAGRAAPVCPTGRRYTEVERPASRRRAFPGSGLSAVSVRSATTRRDLGSATAADGSVPQAVPRGVRHRRVRRAVAAPGFSGPPGGGRPFRGPGCQRCRWV